MQVWPAVGAGGQPARLRIRARREEIDRDPSIVWDALREGGRIARELAEETLTMVRQAMKIDFPELR